MTGLQTVLSITTSVGSLAGVMGGLKSMVWLSFRPSRSATIAMRARLAFLIAVGGLNAGLWIYTALFYAAYPVPLGVLFKVAVVIGSLGYGTFVFHSIMP